MDYDAVDFLESLFRGGPAMAPGAIGAGPVSPVVGDPLDNAAECQAVTPFANWVRRLDCHGRMGWEAPDLPEWQRWWARCDFDDLPPVPEGFRLGEIQDLT